jgi:pyruvate dehydrogenase complex dehydrogenase (E1) component
MEIGDFFTAKQRAKNNTHVRLKMNCCRLVELTQNIRIKIANADREHTKKVRLKAGKYLSRRVKLLTIKITGGRTRNNSQPHLGTTVTGIPSLFPVE